MPRGVRLPDRDAAARLTNTRLYIERERLPAPDEEEFYLADLVGLQAVAPDGAMRWAGLRWYTTTGRARALRSWARDAAVIVPFTRACVPEVDVAAGRLVVAMPDEVEVAGADVSAAGVPA